MWCPASHKLNRPLGLSTYTTFELGVFSKLHAPKPILIPDTSDVRLYRLLNETEISVILTDSAKDKVKWAVAADRGR